MYLVESRLSLYTDIVFIDTPIPDVVQLFLFICSVHVCDTTASQMQVIEQRLVGYRW